MFLIDPYFKEPFHKPFHEAFTDIMEAAQANMIQELKTFLQGAIDKGSPFKTEDFHVVFRCGTFVRCQATKDKFIGFHSNEYDFPTHRLEDPEVLPEVLENNQTIYQKATEIKSDCPKYIEVLNSAYNLLVKDGYPYPGGEGADRLPIPTSKHGGLVMFPTRDPYVMNVVHSSMMADPNHLITPMHMVMIGGEGRRNDYMEPVPIAIFDRHLNVYNLNVELD